MAVLERMLRLHLSGNNDDIGSSWLNFRILV